MESKSDYIIQNTKSWPIGIEIFHSVERKETDQTPVPGQVAISGQPAAAVDVVRLDGGSTRVWTIQG